MVTTPGLLFWQTILAKSKRHAAVARGRFAFGLHEAWTESCMVGKENPATGTRTGVARARAEYRKRLTYDGLGL